MLPLLKLTHSLSLTLFFYVILSLKLSSLVFQRGAPVVQGQSCSSLVRSRYEHNCLCLLEEGSWVERMIFVATPVTPTGWSWHCSVEFGTRRKRMSCSSSHGPTSKFPHLHNIVGLHPLKSKLEGGNSGKLTQIARTRILANHIHVLMSWGRGGPVHFSLPKHQDHGQSVASSVYASPVWPASGLLASGATIGTLFYPH